MPSVLTNLMIKEVSSVDRGAGEGVKIVLMKKQIEDAPVPKGFMKSLKAAFKAMGKPTSTDPDGDGDDDTTCDPDKNPDVLQDMENGSLSLKKSVESIIGDEALTPAQKQEKLDETFKQYNEHVSGTVPEAVAKAIIAAGLVAKRDEPGDTTTSKKETTMADKKTPEQMQEDCEKLQKALDFANLPDAHKAYAIEKAMTDVQKAEWMAKTAADREKDMADDKAKKADDMQKNLAPDVIAKLAQFDTMQKTIEDLQKKDQLGAFVAKAVEMGIPGKGETLQKAYSGDKTAVDELCGMLKAAVAQVQAAGLFREFGSTVGKADASATAYDAIVAKGEELRKQDPKLSTAQAFAKAYGDPANAALVQKHKEETAPKMVAA